MRIKNMRNRDIRDYAKTKGVPLWMIARELHINDGNFSRRLRNEFPENEKAEIYTIIDKLSEEQ